MFCICKVSDFLCLPEVIALANYLNSIIVLEFCFYSIRRMGLITNLIVQEPLGLTGLFFRCNAIVFFIAIKNPQAAASCQNISLFYFVSIIFPSSMPRLCCEELVPSIGEVVNKLAPKLGGMMTMTF
jgi:hypothetical protein